MRRRFSAFPMAAVLVAAFSLHAAGSMAQSLEYPVKANYLVRFAAFVQWQPAAFRGPQSPVTICVIGRDPFGQMLDRAAAGQTAYGRPLTVVRPTTAEALGGCHIAYVGAAAPAGWVEALDATPNTLTVTDAAVSPHRGAVHFVISENRVRFHIDQQIASHQRLTISSRLLSLALSVQGRG